MWTDQGGPKEKKNVFRNGSFAKKTACSSYVQPWLVAIGGWQLVAVDGGCWQLVVGDWWLVVVGSGWRLAVGRCWRLVAVDGSWWLVVGGCWSLGRSLRAVLRQKKKWVP